MCGAGNKASATVQPFLLLHLDIYPDAVRTIEDALHLFSVPESLEGYRASATGKVNSFSMVFFIFYFYETLIAIGWLTSWYGSAKINYCISEEEEKICSSLHCTHTHTHSLTDNM